MSLVYSLGFFAWAEEEKAEEEALERDLVAGRLKEDVVSRMLREGLQKSCSESLLHMDGGIRKQRTHLLIFLKKKMNLISGLNRNSYHAET